MSKTASGESDVPGSALSSVVMETFTILLHLYNLHSIVYVLGLVCRLGSPKMFSLRCCKDIQKDIQKDMASCEVLVHGVDPTSDCACLNLALASSRC
jgi:hypothetical protein